MTDSSAIEIHRITAMGALELKHELDVDGLVNGQDYTWLFCPVKYNYAWSTNPIEQSKAVFTFSDASMASFYRLKWTK